MILDWCYFCKNDDWYAACVDKCSDCTQKNDEKPSEFEEKASVTAYRKAMEGEEDDKVQI